MSYNSTCQSVCQRQAMISYIELLILIALASAERASVNVTTPKTCILDNVEVMKVFHTMESCFSEIIQDQIGTSSASKPGCHHLQDFNTTFENFRHHAIDSCVSEEYRYVYKQRKLYLFDFFAFSLSGNKFKDFYKNNGINCIKTNKDEFLGCVRDITGVPVEAKMDKHNPKYWLNLNRPSFTGNGCENAESIKMCVNDIVNEKCTPGNAQYIISLLDYMIDKCKSVSPKTEY